MSFVLPTPQKCSGRLLREECHPYRTLLRSYANLFFKQKNKMKNTKLVVFNLNKLHEHEDEGENKVPDLWQTKLVLVFVSVLG